MTARLMLDTNAYSAMVRGSEAVAARVRGSERVLLSSVVVGELLYGFAAGTRGESNRARLRSLLDHPAVSVVAVTMDTAERFALVMLGLRRKGTPIPTNDAWIAAHALEYGAELLSADRHFEHVDGLFWSRALAAG